MDSDRSSRQWAVVWGLIALGGMAGAAAATVMLPYWTFSFIGTSELTLWELRSLGSNPFVEVGVLPQFSLQVGWIATAGLWAIGIAASATDNRHLGIPAAILGSVVGLVSAGILLLTQPSAEPLTAGRGSGLWLATACIGVALIGSVMYRHSLVAAITANRAVEASDPEWGPGRGVIKVQSWDPVPTPVVEAQPETVMAFTTPEPEPEPEPSAQPVDQAAAILQQLMTPPPSDD